MEEDEDERGEFNVRDNPAYEYVLGLFGELTAGIFENNDIPAFRDVVKDYSRAFTRSGKGTLPNTQITLKGGKGTYDKGLLHEYDPLVLTVSRILPEGPVPVTGAEDPMIIKMIFTTRKRNGPRLIVKTEECDDDYNRTDVATLCREAKRWYRAIYDEHLPLSKLLGEE